MEYADDDSGLALGSLIDGRYRIDAVLGSGGMGRVYRGEHTGIGRAVAIKVLHADLHRNREAAARFQREALASGRLDHPNIVGVSDFGVLDDGACYLVMEVLEGESLGDRLERDGRIAWREAVDILRGVLLGLDHAHARGVVHRDIKPDNIYLAVKDGEQVVKILDFGIAKLAAGTADDPASTRAGLTVGTPAYLSPEQAVGGEITPGSDIYSATVVLFEMLAGRPPFEDGDALAMLGAHVSRTPPALAEVAPDAGIPAGLEQVVSAGLAKARRERIASAGDYLARLEGIAATAEGSAPVVRRMPSRALTPLPDAHAPTVTLASATNMVALGVAVDEAPAIPRRWLHVGAGIVALAVLAVLVFVVRGGDSAPRPGLASQPAVVVAEEPAAGRPAASSPPRAAARTPAPVPAPAAVPAPRVAETTATPAPAAAAAPAPSATVSRDAQLKALLHDLKTARTCPLRRKAIAPLVALDDRRAIEPLRRARYRGVGGLLGFREKNANWCLTKDVDAALKKLRAGRP